jgi:hypothetical protein
MTQLLDRAIAKTKTLSASRQDEMAAMLLEIANQETSAMQLSPAQQAEVRRRMSMPADLVSDAEMEAFFRKLT